MKKATIRVFTTVGAVLVCALLSLATVGCSSEEALGREVVLASTEPAAAKSVETRIDVESHTPEVRAAAEAATDPEQTLTVDVVVYATQTSGLAAVRELTLAAPHLKVALVSCGNLLETPLAQGLSVEDARNIDRIKGGFYAEWRKVVTDIYNSKGSRPGTNRFVYEPEVAAEALWRLARGPGSERPSSSRLLLSEPPTKMISAG